MYHQQCHYKEHNVPIVLNILNKNKKQKMINCLIWLVLSAIRM